MEITNPIVLESSQEQKHILPRRERLLTRMIEDVQTALSRDPAARNALEVVSSYAGVHALWGYRIAHWLWKHNLKLVARWVSQIIRNFTGVEIHPAARIGRRFFIDHGMGVVIGETAEIGENVTLYHGVTLGGVSLEKGKRHPTIEDDVVLGAGAIVLGPITIGQGSRVGANAVVVKPVPAGSVVVGVPGQVIHRNHQAISQLPDLDHGSLPDAVKTCLHDLLIRVDVLEQQLKIHEHTQGNLQLEEDGTWKMEGLEG